MIKTVIITTSNQPGRQERATADMAKWGIPFEFHVAHHGPPLATPFERACNLWDAVRNVLEANRDQPYLMVMEDDCYFTRDPFEIELPRGDWWQFYLAANIKRQTFKVPGYPDWSLLQGAWGTYCVIYTNQGINWIAHRMSVGRWHNALYDDWCANYLHYKGRSLVYNEPVAMTYPNFSEMDQRECDYQETIAKSYKYIAR